MSLSSLGWILRHQQKQSAIAFTLFAGVAFAWITMKIIEMVVGLPGVFYVSFIIEGLQVVMGATLLYILILFRYNLFDHVAGARHHVVENIDDAVVVIDPTGTVIDYNGVMVDLLENESPVGESVINVLPGDIAGLDVVRSPSEGRRTVQIETGEQTEFYEVNVSKLTGGDGDIGWAIIVRDVTELKQRTRDLERQSEQLEQITDIVGHDVRNPLAVAQTYLMEIERQEQLEETETIREALNQMDDIIDDALVLAEGGNALVETDWYDLGLLVEEAWEMSQTKNAELDNRVAEETMILSDPGRLRTVLENLFRNTVVHGAENATVRVGVLSEGEGFYVEDDGPGIPEQDRQRVFRQAYTTEDGATGLGLNIVQSIAAAHEWEVKVCASPDGGARFEFRDVRLRDDQPVGS